MFYSTSVVLLVLIGKIALGVRFRWRPFVLVWGPCYGVMAQMDVVSIFRHQLMFLACVTFWCTLFAVIDIFFGAVRFLGLLTALVLQKFIQFATVCDFYAASANL